MRKHSQNNTYRPFLSLLASISISLLTISCGCNNLQSDQSQQGNQEIPTLKLQLIAQGPTYLVGDNKNIYLKVEKAADSIEVDLSKLTLQPSRKLGNVAHLILPNPDGSAQEVKDQDKISVQGLGGIGAFIKMGIEGGNDTETAFAFQLLYDDKPIGNELTFTWRFELDDVSQKLLDAIKNPATTKEDIEALIIQNNISNVNIADQKGQSMLYHAVKRGNPDIVQILVDSGADVNAVDNHANRSLLWAAYKGYQEVVKKLLASGALVDQANKKDETPLYWAVAAGQLHVIELLLKAGANPDLEVNGQSIRELAQTKGPDIQALFAPKK